MVALQSCRLSRRGSGDLHIAKKWVTANGPDRYRPRYIRSGAAPPLTRV